MRGEDVVVCVVHVNDRNRRSIAELTSPARLPPVVLDDGPLGDHRCAALRAVLVRVLERCNAVGRAERSKEKERESERWGEGEMENERAYS